MAEKQVDLAYLRNLYTLMMKVLLLNTYEQRGGAARAAFRLFEGLLAAGTDARMLVQEKQSDHPSVLKLH